VFTNATFQVWRTSDLRSPGPLPMPFTNFACAAVSSRGEMIAFADQAGNAVLWRAADRSVIPFGRPQTNDYSRMAFSHDGRRLAFASDRKVSVWEVSNRTETHSFDKPATDSTTMWVGFSPDGNALASGNFSGNVRFWSLDRPRQEAHLAAHEFQVNGCDFTPDGKTLVTSQGHLCLWDLPGGSLRRKVDDLPGHAVKVAFSPDGSRLAVGFDDGTITIFDYPEMQELIRLTELDEVYRLAFSADGRTLVAASRYEIRSWNGAPAFAVPMNPTQETTPP
jgi:WD40 repeat protein